MRHTATLLVAIGFALAVVLSVALDVRGACQMTEREWYNPTGWEGCTVYGIGYASRYDGPGVARNDCLHPWTDCQPITITAHETGRSVTVTPRMFCDCFLRTADEKLVDLDRATVRELGLRWADGRYAVTVEPALPDTAVD